MSDDLGLTAQVPGLPSGGGSVHGLGETFTPDLATGTGTFSIPLDLPAGPDDIAPKLVLRYDSGSGNGPFGAGFSLPLPRIVRSSATSVPRYDGEDTFVLEGAGELVSFPDDSLGLQVDSGSWQVARDGDGFLLTARSGSRHWLGVSTEARSGTPAFAWQLERIEDSLGNAVKVRWRHDLGQVYLQEVAYGPYLVRFEYEQRPDVLRWGRAGVLVTTALRCSRIELRCPADTQPLVRRWSLAYEPDPVNGASLLTTVTLTGVDVDGNEATAPPLRLGYTQPGKSTLRRVQVDDDASPAPITTGSRRVEVVDWDGNGLPDLLEVSEGGSARVWPNRGGLTLGAPSSAGELPTLADLTMDLLLLDVDGDGSADVAPATLDGYTPHRTNGFAPPVSWREVPTRNLFDPSTRLLDLDGDGLPDLLTGTSDNWLLAYREESLGWRTEPQVVPASETPEVDLSDPHVSIADMTGDGLADLVRVDGGGVTYWPYLGWGKWASPVRPAISLTLPGDVDPSRVFVVDLDGDGAADLLYLGEDSITAWFNQGGERFSSPIELDGISVSDLATPRIVDMDGSGTAGLLWSIEGPLGQGTAYLYLDFLGGRRHGVLDRIDNGLGLTTTIEYSTSAKEATRDLASGEAWRSRLPVVVPVVGSISRSDAFTGGGQVTKFAYHDGRFDGVLREFAGFGRVTQEELGDAHAPTLRTIRWFENGADPVRPEEVVPRADRLRLRAVRGRMIREETYGQDTVLPYRSVEHEWTVERDGEVYRPRQTRSVTKVFELQPDPVSTVTTDASFFDLFGNATRTVETAETTGAPPVVLETLTTYAVDQAKRFVALPARVRQRDGSGAILADTISRYDNLADGRVGTRGLVTERESLVLTKAMVTALYGGDVPDLEALGYHRRPGEDGWWITTHYERTEDVDGLRGRIVGPRGHGTEIRYSADRCFAEEFTDAGGNVTRAVRDHRTARVTELTQPSGAVYRASYDPLARNESVVQPGDSLALPTVRYRYDTRGPVTVTTKQCTVSGEAATLATTVVYDGYGLEISRSHPDAEGEVVDEHHEYCARGLVRSSARPYRSGDGLFLTPPAGTPSSECHYDALGRPVRVTQPDGTTRTITYLPGIVEERDGQSALTRRHFDATGRIKTVEEQLGERLVSSFYRYDVKGNLLEFHGPDGSVVTTSYDLLGRALRVVRPERTVVNVLDAAGNPVESRTLGGHTVRRRFDFCDRVSEVLVDNGTVPVTTFTYHDSGLPAPPDAGVNTAGGRLVRVDDESGVTILDYDERGHTTTKRSRPLGFAAELRLDVARRADDRVTRTTMPAADGTRLVVEQRYDEVGRLAQIPGYVDAVEYDDHGRRTAVSFANGVRETFEYDPLREHLARHVVTGPGGVLRDVSISTDPAGNVLGLTSPDPALNASYAYDDCYRLVSAVQGNTVYAYAYDDAGNLTHKSDVGDFGYTGTQLTSAGGATFSYDPSGNVTEAPWGNHIWDAFGRLRGVHGSDGVNAVFGYDHAGNRVRTLVTNGETHEVLTPDDAYAVEDGVLVAVIAGMVRRRADGTTAFLHFDHLRSLVLVTDAAGVVVEQRHYDPYGARVSTDGVGPDFSGGVNGGVAGLVQFEARWYHPRYGRFLSPDPIVAHVYIPISWNAYAFARNNPTSYTDPTGHAWWKWLVAVVAVVALVALTIVTFGAGSVLLGLAVAAGVLTGGIMGGITAARAGGDFGDILFGALTGAAICGWAAFGGGLLGGIGLNLGLGATGNLIVGGAIMGALSGGINGAAMGLSMGIAEGASFDRLMIRIAEGALLGAAVGAATGALSGALKAGLINKPANTPLDKARQLLEGPRVPGPDTPQPMTFGSLAGKVGGAVFGDWALYAGALTTNVATQTLLVDLTAGVTGAWHDEIGTYLRNLGLSLGFLTNPLPD